MAKCGLYQEELRLPLKARSAAKPAVDLIVEKCDDVTFIEKEVDVVCNNTKSSLYIAWDHYETSYGYKMILVTLLIT